MLRFLCVLFLSLNASPADAAVDEAFIMLCELRDDRSGMPGEQVLVRQVKQPDGPVALEVNVTTKGNGWLTGPGLRVKVYDSHDDGTLFEGRMHVVSLHDVNGDGALDVIVAGHELHRPNGASTTERRPVLDVWLFDAEAGRFNRAD